jgi:hypothetical protein
MPKTNSIGRETHYVDSTTVGAHQHAAGAKGAARDTEALGYGRDGFSTKIHLRAQGDGKPMVFVLTAGQRNERWWWPSNR